jgi:uncharacterized membrane protein YgdD (TMEM256/DUF423 family)
VNQPDPSNTKGAASAAPFAMCALAGLAGAAGVALAAVAAHKVDSPALATAATMLMIHAGAVLAIAAIALRSENARRWTAVSGLMLAAVSLFSGDIALNTFAGWHIFPMAAPTGGSLLIASWLAVAVISALEWRVRQNV